MLRALISCLIPALLASACARDEVRLITPVDNVRLSVGGEYSFSWEGEGAPFSLEIVAGEQVVHSQTTRGPTARVLVPAGAFGWRVRDGAGHVSATRRFIAGPFAEGPRVALGSYFDGDRDGLEDFAFCSDGVLFEAFRVEAGRPPVVSGWVDAAWLPRDGDGVARPRCGVDIPSEEFMNYPEATRCGVRRFSELPDYVGVETTGGPCGWRVLVGVDGEFESRIDSMPPLPGDFDGDGVCDYMGSILHEGVGPRLAIVAFGVDHALREVDGDFERDSGRAWVRDLDGDGIDEIVVVTEGLPDGWQRGDDVAILVEVLRISPVLDRFDRVAALPLLYAANRRDYAAVDARAGVVGVRGTTALVSTSWENSLLLIDFGNLDRGSDLEVQECGVGSAALVCAPSVHVAARVEMTAAGWAIVAAP